MAHFPLCIDLAQARVLLVGSGPEIAEKKEKLAPFQPEMICLDSLSPRDLSPRPAMVIIGDVPRETARSWSALCTGRDIPVNVVDVPELCSFYMPALVRKGGITVAISSGGACPSAAAYLGREIRQLLPDRTEEILDWLQNCRRELRAVYPAAEARCRLRELTEEAFRLGRPLTREELQTLWEDR